MNDATPIDARIRAVLAQHGKLARDAGTLPESADLFEAGLSSHASVNLMLALESEFDVEFPDQMLTRSVFSSVAAIRGALVQMLSA